MKDNTDSLPAIKSHSNDFSNTSLFNYINSIQIDRKSNLDILQNIKISHLHAKALSGFRPNCFPSTESYSDFIRKINKIESISIIYFQPQSVDIFRIMILICFLAIKSENLNLKKINDKDIEQNEIELANKLQKIDGVVSLINEGWLISNLKYHQITQEIDSIEFSNGTETILITPSNPQDFKKSLECPLSSPHSQKIISPSSPHSNQHSINRQRKQSTRQFDRTDYSTESSNNNDDDETDDEMGIETIFTDAKNTRLPLSRRTYSEPFITLDPMFIFENEKRNENESKTHISQNSKNNKIKQIDVHNNDIKMQPNRRKINNPIKKNKPKNNKNNDFNKSSYTSNYSYSSYSYSNSSDFDYSYYSSGEEETISNNDRNYSTERRRHHHRHRQMSKRIKSKLELRKLEETPNRVTQLYIDEFDDVRKLHSKHQNIQTDSEKKCKNNNIRDLDENDINDSDEEEFNENKSNIDFQRPLKIKLNQTKLPIFNSYDNITEEEDDDDDLPINRNNSCSYFNEINDEYMIDDNDDHLIDNSSSDSNEDFDDLEYEPNKNNKKKNNCQFDQDEDDGNEKILPNMNEDIYCSEPFPTNNGNSNDNSLLSPNHRKPARTGKKRQIM